MQVGERIAPERRIEGAERVVQHLLQPTAAREQTGVALGMEALGGQVAAFGEAHGGRYVDLVRRARKAHAALAAARVDEQAFAPEEVHHLDEGMLGDAERPGDLGDGRAPLGRLREVDQHPQAVIGECAEAHL